MVFRKRNTQCIRGIELTGVEMLQEFINDAVAKMHDLVCSKFINCAYLDRQYEPVHEIITLTIEI